MANAGRDGNRVTTLIVFSNADNTTPINLWADPTTHRLLVDATAAISYDSDWLTLRANYTATQTNTAIVTAGAAETIVVKKCAALLDHACSVDVSVLIGFHASTTPTTTGVVLSHPGLAAGSGIIEFFGDTGIASQTLGDDLLITSEIATGGSLDIVVVYKII